MPELPEVETTRRGVAPHLVGRMLTGAAVREPRMRWPVPADLHQRLAGRRVERLDRRGKYLLVGLDDGAGLVLHLGMSGSLRVTDAAQAPAAHDHVDLLLDDGRCLRLRDPRRFGAVLWTPGPPEGHPLLAALGPEPLGPRFSGAYLHDRSRGRRAPVKSFLMDARVVAGVGNIYANEALHLAGIHPLRAAGRIALARYLALAAAVRRVLEDSIAAGGTTLRDFVGGSGAPGYYRQALRVYGRAGEPCPGCGGALRQRVVGQRATVYCHRCQT